MTIDLITKEELNELLKIQKSHPILTYEAKGYDTFDKSKITKEDNVAFSRVWEILAKTVAGFSSFQNFTISERTAKLRIRFQYDYSATSNDRPFTGVGYINVNDLHYGFTNDKLKE